MKNIKSPILSVIAALFIASCQTGGEPAKPVEQELITTVKLNVTDGSGFNKTFSYKVQNGFGTSTPGTVTKDEIVLAPNKEYHVEVLLLDESKTPATNITEEVISESTDHLFLYECTPEGLISFSSGNKDASNQAFNQRIVFNTGSAGIGSLVVVLKHLPTNKAATKVADAGGETDVEVNFDVKLQ